VAPVHHLGRCGEAALNSWYLKLVGQSDALSVSRMSRRALALAIVLLVGSPAWGFADTRSMLIVHKFFWVLPVLAGVIPVLMGVAAIVQVILNRPMRGLLAALGAIALGCAAALAGLLFLLSGAVGRDLML
jgi:hypothetical protein